MSERDRGEEASTATDLDVEDDVPTGPSLWEQLLSGAANKPVLGVFVVILLLLAAGFLFAGLFVAAQFLL